MKELKCRFKGLADGYEINFKNQSVLVSLSIWEDVESTVRLFAMLKLVFQNFATCTIALGDTLQRHTMAIQTGRTSADCYQQAKLLGDQWLATHEKICKDYEDRIKIIRWDEWLNHPLFKDSEKMIKDEIENDAIYCDYFHESIDTYLNRYENRLRPSNLFNRKKAEALCLAYLIEECAALCIWPTTSCRFEMYNGVPTLAMQETLKRFVHQKQNYSLQMLSVLFNHRPDLNPQKLYEHSVNHEVQVESYV
jgi:hypothetical protein